MKNNKKTEEKKEKINNIKETEKVEKEELKEQIQEEALEENKELKEALMQANEYKDKYQRTLAEFDNYRKRTIKEKEEIFDIGVMETVEKILPMIDNFERALAELSKDITEDEVKNHSMFKGINMIYNQFIDILKNIGVCEMDCVGKEFNPDLHNAVMHTQDDKFGENQISEVFQKGYMYKDKVIRHPMVRVVN